MARRKRPITPIDPRHYLTESAQRPAAVSAWLALPREDMAQGLRPKVPNRIATRCGVLTTSSTLRLPVRRQAAGWRLAPTGPTLHTLGQ